MLFIIIIITCIFSIKGFKNLTFFNKYKFQIQSINKGEKYRMWSSAFLHADYSHLFFNLFTLWVFSGAILMKLGGLYYLIIYLLSLYFGNLFTLKQHKNQILYSAVGASGAVTGIVYSSILLFPEGSRSNDGQIKPFKSGGLGLGISTGLPIVPVAIIGTFESLGKESTSFENNLLTVQIGSPIDTNEYIENDRKILSKLVYERVKELKRNHPV